MIKFWRELTLLFLVSMSVAVFSKEVRIKIAVLDTGLNITKQSKPWLCTDGQYDFTGKGLDDKIGHGTNISGLIVKGLDASKFCIVMIKYYDTEKDTVHSHNEALLKSWELLKTLDIKYVNMSLSGMSFWHEEHKTIKYLLDKGIKVIVSSGNNGINLSGNNCVVFPACYKFIENYYVVGAIDGKFSNVGTPVRYYQLGVNQRGFGISMSGTSQAAANQTNLLLRNLK